MEEFGTTGDKETTYTSWYSTIESSGLTGDLIWWVWIQPQSLRLLNIIPQASWFGFDEWAYSE